MAQPPYRYLHAGDFQLGEPLSGVCHVAPEFEKLFRDAPYRAVEKVFDIALEQRVSFVLLTGDLYSSEAGLGPIDFLSQQLDRLEGIPVYWASGHGTEYVPFDLPQHVQHFVPGDCEQVRVKRGRMTLATLYGFSAPEDPPKVPDECDYPIVVQGDGVPALHTDRGHVRYWALGGKENPRLKRRGKATVYRSGTPQGRTPHATGIRGCVVVQVDSGQPDRLRTHPTDALRWLDDPVVLAPDADEKALRAHLVDRAGILVREHPGRALFVSWSVDCGGKLGGAIRHGALTFDLHQAVQEDLSARDLPVAVVAVEAPFQSIQPEWVDEDSLLGEFLHTVRDWKHQADGFDFASEVPVNGSGLEVEAWLGIDDQGCRDARLRDVTVAGVDLLNQHTTVDALIRGWSGPHDD